jgi:GT2 family glycosyltransferase
VTELSLLIVNFNSWRLSIDAVRSFAEHAPTRGDGSPMPWEAIVVDNASPQRDPAAERELAELCASTGGKLILHDENGGYSGGMNLAYRHARGRWLVVSNPDVHFRAGTIDALLRAMEARPEIGAAAPEGYWDEALEGRLPPNILPTLGDLVRLTLADLFKPLVHRYSRRRTRDALRVWLADGDVELEMLSGCCFVMDREFIERIGFFDERFPLYYEDTDLSMRIRGGGKKIVQVHGSKIVHLYNRSAETTHGEAMRRYWISRRLYYRKWYGWLGGFLYGLSRKLLQTSWAQRRARRVPHDDVRDLGAGQGKVVLELPRPRERFLVEFALDPRFYLAGGTFGSGDRWMPSDLMFARFGPTTWWFRVVETDPPYRQIAIYRYEQRYPLVLRPHTGALRPVVVGGTGEEGG